MARQVAAQAALRDDVLEAVVARTDGVPLFVEELTRSVVEGDSATEAIPATLHDTLMARLDRLGEAREVIQIASVIGREFAYGLVRTLCDGQRSEAWLEAALQKLVAADLVQVRGLGPEATYTFRHALVQEAAYESLLKSRRRELHARVAAALGSYCPRGGVLRFETPKPRRPEHDAVRVYRCRQCSRDPRGRTVEVSEHEPALARQRAKHADPAKRAVLRQRAGIIEPVFGSIKDGACGFRRWTVAGLAKVRVQWALVCAGHNVRKLYRFWRAGTLRPAA